MTVQDVDSDTRWLPDEIQYGYVADRVLRAIGDTKNDDDRYPDGVPAKGTIRFEPERSLKYTTTQPATVIKDAIECTIYQGDEDGEDNDRVGLLVDPAGHVGNVALIAGWYQVTYRLDSGSVPRFRIHVTPEHTVDDPLWLPRAAPITPAPSERFVVNEQVYRETLAARDKTKDYRDETQTARDQADMSASSSASSAAASKTDADRAEAAANSLQIDIDTSAGTKVTVGGVVVSYDSGARDISSNVLDGWTVRANGLTVHRKNSQVVAVIDVSRNEDGGNFANIFDPPQGFKPAIRARILPAFISTSKQGWIDSIADTIRIRDLSTSLSEGDRLTMTVTWQTDDPYPSTLPGTPA